MQAIIYQGFRLDFSQVMRIYLGRYYVLLNGTAIKSWNIAKTIGGTLLFTITIYHLVFHWVLIRERCYQHPVELQAFVDAVREYKRATLTQEHVNDKLDALKEAKKNLLLVVV